MLPSDSMVGDPRSVHRSTGISCSGRFKRQLPPNKYQEKTRDDADRRRGSADRMAGA